jgi:hypothetical protein
MGRGEAGRGWQRRGGVEVASALLVALAGAVPAFANPSGGDAMKVASRQGLPGVAPRQGLPGVAPRQGLPGVAAAALAFAPAGPDLRLDGRVAGRLLADAKETTESDPSAPATEEDKGKPGEKSDEIKMTVSKGPATGPKKGASGSDDTFAFVKDWPFWAAVGGVIIVGAAVFMINRNSNQDHTCPGVYNAGCFGAK